MALAAQALFAQATALDAADVWDGAPWPDGAQGSLWVLMRERTAASADKLLQGLLAVFTEKQLQRALALVDQRGVSCVVARGSKRVLFQVRGQAVGEVYTCFPGHFCCCHAFMFDVVGKGAELSCKHMLAANLAHALGRCNVFEVSDAELARLLDLGLDT